MTRRTSFLPLHPGWRLEAWLAAPAALLLSGCVNLAPTYERPAAPVPPAWAGLDATQAASVDTTAATTTAAPASADDIGWRDFFVDERLRGTVGLALANNRDLRVAALNIERARAQYGIVRASAFPSVDLGAGGSRSRTPGSLATGGQARISTQYSVDVGLASYELDLFGRVRNLGDAALEGFFATEESRRSMQISLVAEVATAWLVLATDQQRLQRARDTLASQHRSYELIRRSHELGAQSGLALAQSQSTVDAARVDVATYESQVEQSRNALDLLVGTTPPAELLPPVPVAAPVAATASSSSTSTSASAMSATSRASMSVLDMAPAARLLEPPAGLPSSVLQQRPDVLAAEHALRASNADIGAARAAFYPRIALTGSAGIASSSLSGLFKSGSAAWSFAPSISVPIFDGGVNRANLRVVEVQQQIQLASYEKTLQGAFREVADALAVRRTLAKRLAAQQSLLAATARSFELSDALFRSGAAGYLDVLDAQRSLYSAQQSLIGLQLVEQTNRVTLYRVLGGGWRESTSTTQEQQIAVDSQPGASAGP